MHPVSPVGHERRAGTNSSTPERFEVGPRLGLAQILITDDQPAMLRLVDRALGGQYRCEFAGNVIQAHKKLSSTSFQLALCDLQMLGGSGLALAE
jgi:PleD family two-component response regulator